MRQYHSWYPTLLLPLLKTQKIKLNLKSEKNYSNTNERRHCSGFCDGIFVLTQLEKAWEGSKVSSGSSKQREGGQT